MNGQAAKRLRREAGMPQGWQRREDRRHRKLVRRPATADEKALYAARKGKPRSVLDGPARGYTVVKSKTTLKLRDYTRILGIRATRHSAATFDKWGKRHPGRTTGERTNVRRMFAGKMKDNVIAGCAARRVRYQQLKRRIAA